MTSKTRSATDGHSQFFQGVLRLGLPLLALLAGLAWSGVLPAQSAIRLISVVVNRLSTPTLAFADASLAMIVGESRSNPAHSDQSGSKGVISYRSSNDAVARVTNDGELTAVAPGSATITATQTEDPPEYMAGTGSYEVTVADAPPLTADAAFAARNWLVKEVVPNDFMPVIAAGGVGALHYAVTPPLPAGLALSSDTGVLSGSPTSESAPASYTITVSDSATPAHVTQADFRMGVGPELIVTRTYSGSLERVEGYPINDTPLTATGGIGRLRYTISTIPSKSYWGLNYLADIPHGLTWDAERGAISGVVPVGFYPWEGSFLGVVAIGTYKVTVTDSDSPAHSVEAFWAINIRKALFLSPDIYPPMAVGMPSPRFSLAHAAGGIWPYHYSVSPPLPAGLTMNEEDGQIPEAIPSASVERLYTVTVVDSATPPASVSLEVMLRIYN